MKVDSSALKGCRIAAICTRAMCWLQGGYITVLLVLLLRVAVDPKTSFRLVFMGYEGGPAAIELGKRALADDLLHVFSALFFALLLLLAFQQFDALFRSVRTEFSPFTAKNVRRLKRASVYIALGSVLPALSQEVFVHAFHAAPGQSFQVSYLLIGVLLFGLSSVFSHGVRLQRQDDETL